MAKFWKVQVATLVSSVCWAALLSAAFAQMAERSAKPSAVPRTPVTDVAHVALMDGPYIYKGDSDLIGTLGWKVVDAASKAADTVSFRLCDGTLKTVKVSGLTRVNRACPAGSPLGPWYANGNVIISVPSGSGTAQTVAVKDLPKEFHNVATSWKNGDLVGYSFHPAGGKASLGILQKSLFHW